MLRRTRLLAAPAAALLLALSACTTGSTDGNGDSSSAAQTETKADANAFPVTIKHAFGETTVESEPKRVATVGWTDQDHALALGVVPVGATKITWGGNAAGSTDWFDEEIEDLDATAPVRYDDTDGIPFDEISKVSPDLILATNSGITKEDYDKLSGIAPVVAYPEAPWVTPWQTSLDTVGKALGRSTLAAEVKKDAEEEIAEAREENPEIQGKTLIFGYLTTTDLSQIGIYAPEDPRVSFMHDLGLVDAPSVKDAIKPGEFYGQVSAERGSELASDVFLTWSETDKDMDTFTADKLIGQIPAIKNGHAYAEADKPTAMAVTNPTPLSIETIVDTFLPKVVTAVKGS
ncbi:MAG: iron-siderophore ABC transporter substrate-binding protein [Myxococcales bacterium]|nr:MAG: iron-siderophore ABC transporter substrate-binding protein [Myxococcales bacterium]